MFLLWSAGARACTGLEKQQQVRGEGGAKPRALGAGRPPTPAPQPRLRGKAWPWELKSLLQVILMQLVQKQSRSERIRPVNQTGSSVDAGSGSAGLGWSLRCSPSDELPGDACRRTTSVCWAPRGLTGRPHPLQVPVVARLQFPPISPGSRPSRALCWASFFLSRQSTVLLLLTGDSGPSCENLSPSAPAHAAPHSVHSAITRHGRGGGYRPVRLLGVGVGVGTGPQRKQKPEFRPWGSEHTRN